MVVDLLTCLRMAVFFFRFGICSNDGNFMQRFKQMQAEEDEKKRAEEEKKKTEKKKAEAAVKPAASSPGR